MRDEVERYARAVEDAELTVRIMTHALRHTADLERLGIATDGDRRMARKWRSAAARRVQRAHRLRRELDAVMRDNGAVVDGLSRSERAAPATGSRAPPNPTTRQHDPPPEARPPGGSSMPWAEEGAGMADTETREESLRLVREAVQETELPPALIAKTDALQSFIREEARTLGLDRESDDFQLIWITASNAAATLLSERGARDGVESAESIALFALLLWRVGVGGA